MKLLVVLIFLSAYAFLIAKKGNPLVVLGTAIAALLLSGAITSQQALSSININVLGILWGVMALSSLFIFSRVPAFLAARLVDRAKNAGMAMLSVCILAGVISSVVDNVATVLIVAPIAFEVAGKLKVNPIPFIIGIAVSANLQGCATMVGDSPSIILALSTGMNFMDFFWMKGRPGIAFAVELGAVASFIVLFLIFRKNKEPVITVEPVKVITWVPAILLGLMMLSLAASSFLPSKRPNILAGICLTYGAIGLVWYQVKYKGAVSVLKKIDWQTFFFLIGIFVLVGSLTHRGIITDVANFIIASTQGNALVAFVVVVGASVLLSAFIDNIPYTIAMIPVAQLVANSVGVGQELFLFGLLIGTSLGGNITPIGASANVVAVGLLQKEGHKVSFGAFAKIGIPFTLAAVSTACVFLWWVWGP